jgi:hypothetical protein
VVLLRANALVAWSTCALLLANSMKNNVIDVIAVKSV